MTSRRDAIKYSAIAALLSHFPWANGQSSSGLTPAQYWQQQASLRPPKSPTPAPTYYVDAIRGNNLHNGTTKASALQTIERAITLSSLTPGTVIALANDSVFDLTQPVRFINVAGTASARIYLTNYDPGGAPDTLPKIRYRFKPTSAQWIWDTAKLAWYFVHPNNSTFGYAYVRFNDGTWGSSYTYTKDFAKLQNTKYAYLSDQEYKRIYVHAPAGTDPTTYYGGITIAGDELGCLLMQRGGSYVTIENIDFEESPTLVTIGAYTNTAANIVDFEIRNCHGTNVVGLLGAWADPHQYTVQVHAHDCTLQHYAAAGITLANNSRNSIIEDNWFVDGGKGNSSAGGVYLQERQVATAANLTGTIVRRNFIDTYANGVGDHPFDGAGLYCEINSDGCLIQNNIVINCRTALQDNSGRSNKFVGNLLICDRALMITDQMPNHTTQTIFDGNTIYSQTNRNAYPAPGAAASSSNAVVAWRIDNANSNYSFKARANVIRAAGFVGRQAVFLFGSDYGTPVPSYDLTGNTVSNAVPLVLPASTPAGTQQMDLEGLTTNGYTAPGITTVGSSGSVSNLSLLGTALSTTSTRGAIG